VAALRACLEAAGYRVHAYTSPHLVHFNERIRVAGGVIAGAPLEALLAECERVNAEAPITFFEITTAAAFLAFARTPADAAILEVGLGGRFDATNVIAAPLATVLTPVSLDHQRFLGDTVAAIAFEKAGILKAGVRAVVGPQTPEAAAVIEARAQALGAPLYRHGRDWSAAPHNGGWRFEGARWHFDLPPPALLGRHQIDNAAAAIACLEGVERFKLERETLAAGLGRIEWPARLQRLTRGPLASLLRPGSELWLDGGHNRAGAEALAAQAEAWRAKPLDLVFGMIESHDAAGFMAALAPHARSIGTVAIPGEAASLSAEQSAAAGRAAGLDAKPFNSMLEAVAAVAMQPGPARILICGSLYLAGAVLRENG